MDVFVSSTSEPITARENSSFRVMIVDDHDIYRYGLRNILNDLDGFTVVAEANCCEDAIERLNLLPIDLVLMDLSLPDCEGLEGVQQIMHTPEPPQVIILSVSMDDDMLLEAILMEVRGYLTKDIPAPEMIKCLQNFQQGELAMLPAVMNRVVSLLVQQCRNLQTEVTLHRQNNVEAPQEFPPVALETVSTTSIQLLTPQEEKVFQLMRRGYSNKQIAAELTISHFTVGKHVQNILRKFGVANRTQAVSSTSFEGV